MVFFSTRLALPDDLPAIGIIYNQGIEDRIATLEADPKTTAQMEEWFAGRSNRHPVLVLTGASKIVGWASLNPFHSRCCYDGVADLSIYLHRDNRGQGLAKILLAGLEKLAVTLGYRKLVLSMLEHNQPARLFYLRHGFREVGTYYQQGILDDRYINIVIMEKLLDLSSGQPDAG